jgi:hypothetical protein
VVADEAEQAVEDKANKRLDALGSRIQTVVLELVALV